MTRTTLCAVAAVAVLCGVLLSAGCKGNQPDEKGKAAEMKEPTAKPADAADLAAQAEQTARTFFEACAREDWEAVTAVAPENAEKFMPVARTVYGGLELIELGKALKDTFKDGEYKGQSYPGYYVPYKVKLKSGEVKEFRIAVRNDGPSMGWRVDGGI